MSNERDKKGAGLSDKQVEDLYHSTSQETTSAKMDQAIMQMAHAHAEQKHSQPSKAQLSWWQNWLSPKKLKYPFSIAAAFVVTLGIARFTAHLSKTDVGPAQTDSVVLANVAQPQSRDISFELVSADANTEQELAFNDRSTERRMPELPSNQEMEALMAESQVVASASEEYMKQKEQAQKEARERYVAKREASQRKVVAEAPEQAIVVTGARVKKVAKPSAEQDHYAAAGVLDEAVSGYPLPEVWLEEIKLLLEQNDQINAIEEWQQFKNTYPEHKVSDPLLEQIKSLQKIGGNG